MNRAGIQVPLTAAWLMGVTVSMAGEQRLSRPPLEVGVDANYVLAMEHRGSAWRWAGRQIDPFTGMAAHGVKRFRVRLWTKDEGPHGRHYATEVMKRASAAGMEPYLVVFLSDDWADMVKQPVPRAWQDLSFEQRAEAVRKYSRDVVTHFRREGLQGHLYEIGNEIDYGICGEYPGKDAKKNPDSLRRRIWPRAATLILASQAGIREADPEAEFMLHTAHWWDAGFCEDFFRFMRDQGVQIDLAGLSYFPSSNIGGSLEMNQFGVTVSRLARALERPVVVAETAYPSTKEFSGQFARWKREVVGYPLTPTGQRRWLADFLAFCSSHPDIQAMYYWSPEWHDEEMWTGFALFDSQGDAKPAWDAFAAGGRLEHAPREPVYLDVRRDELFVVPVREAIERTVPLVDRLRDQTGGVTVEHIRLLSETTLAVGAYAVKLRGALQRNLDLELADAAKGVPLAAGQVAGLEELTAGLDPRRQRVVLIVRGEATPAVTDAVVLLEGKGVQVDVHSMPESALLKFGLDNAGIAAESGD